MGVCKMVADRSAEALALLRQVRDKIHSGQFDTVSAVRACSSVSRILGRTKEYAWIELELNGYPDEKVPAYRRLHVNWYDEYGAVMEVEGSFNTQPIQVPITTAAGNLTRGLSFRPSEGLSDEIYDQARERPGSFRVAGMFLRQVLDRVANRLLEHVDLLILELEYSGIPQSIFEERRRTTDEMLVKASPDAMKKLQSAYENLSKGGPRDDWSPVAVACRKVMKDVADALFPARDKPHKDKSGVIRTVKEDDYVNRILALVDENSGGDKRRLLMAQTQHLGDLLEQVNKLANEGVHAVVTKYEASTLVIYTYLLLGDVLGSVN